MSKTLADHARAYRQRRAEKVRVMRQALETIAILTTDKEALRIARDALEGGR